MERILTEDNISSIVPSVDNAYELGSSSYRWKQIYAATSTINTSDENAKTDILDTTLSLDFINALRPVEFKYKVRENRVTAAVHVDAMAGADDVFLKVVWYYLAGTEFISIAENLRNAGVESLDPLLNFIRSKLGGLK